MGVQLFFIPVVHSCSALSVALQRLKEDLSSAQRVLPVQPRRAGALTASKQ